MRARIAFYSCLESTRPGGSEILWMRTARELHRRNIPLALCLNNYSTTPSLLSEVFAANTPVETLGVEALTLPARLWNRLCPSNRRVTPSLRQYQWLRQVEADLIVVNIASSMVNVAGLTKPLAGRKYVLIIQAASRYDWPNDTKREAWRQLYHGGQHLYLVSENNRQILEDQWGCELDRSSVVANPWHETVQEAVRWPGQNGEALQLATVGRLGPTAKGQDLVLHVLASDRWRDRPVHYTLAGAGQQEQALRDLIQRLGLANVTLAGRIDNISNFWSSHHLAVFPSRYEGLPLALIEAMRCARPGLVTPAGGAEVIDHGKSGFVARAPEVFAVADAMEQAWESRTNLEAMGQTAAAAIRQRLPSDPASNLADKLLGLIDGPSL